MRLQGAMTLPRRQHEIWHSAASNPPGRVTFDLYFCEVNKTGALPPAETAGLLPALRDSFFILTGRQAANARRLTG